jgi:hypothetical protein
MGKDAYYFSHDSNAHKDPKILKLRAKHGWEGYGIYWALIETLREQNEYKWKASDKQLLSFCFANGEGLINQVIDTCLDVGLLVIDEDDFIHSESLTRRMKIKEEISEKRREAGRKGGSKSKSQANAKQNVSKEKKEKESKVNKNKYRDFVFLSDEEYQKLVSEYGKTVIDSKIEDLDNYIGNKRKDPYKDHNRTIRTWLKRDGIKKQTEHQPDEPSVEEKIAYLNDGIRLGKDYYAMTNEEYVYEQMIKERDRLEQLRAN